MTQEPALSFLPLTGIYEPSAIVQLPDGRFLVVEDEKSHPLSVLTLHVDGRVEHTALSAGWLQMFSEFWTLDDLEGLSVDRSGWCYAITSHSRDDEGDAKPSRDKLVRFRVEGTRVVDPQVCRRLKPALTQQHPVLETAALVKDVKGSGGLNIEALEMSADQNRLLVGFRSPLRDGRALIAHIENPGALFDADETPRIAPMLDELDLGGHGIRGLSYVPALGSYLVISGPVSREHAAFALWRWCGEPGTPAQRVTLPGLYSLDKAEGVCPAVIGGEARLVIVSDDGSREAGRYAGYVVLDPARLQTVA